MMNHVERPEPAMLGPMPPISEEIGDHDQHQELDRIGRRPERLDPPPQRNDQHRPRVDRRPQLADRPHQGDRADRPGKVDQRPRDSRLQRIAFNYRDPLDRDANRDREQGQAHGDRNAGEWVDALPTPDRG